MFRRSLTNYEISNLNNLFFETPQQNIAQITKLSDKIHNDQQSHDGKDAGSKISKVTINDPEGRVSRVSVGSKVSFNATERRMSRISIGSLPGEKSPRESIPMRERSMSLAPPGGFAALMGRKQSCVPDFSRRMSRLDAPRLSLYSIVAASKMAKMMQNERLDLTTALGRGLRGWGMRAMAKREEEKPKVKLENTYKMEPDRHEVFKADLVEGVIRDVLTSSLKNFKYTPERCKVLTTRLVADIKRGVKELNFPRYKIVCNVVIMQNKGQGSKVANRCIWNPNTDSHASYTFVTPDVIVVGNVHGVYFE